MENEKVILLLLRAILEKNILVIKLIENIKTLDLETYIKLKTILGDEDEIKKGIEGINLQINK